MTSRTCATPGIQLTIEDLSTVQDVLTTVAHKSKIFGSKINVPHHVMARIEETNGDFDEKLYNLLEYRLKQLPLLTWHDIVRALRSPAVHEEVLASQIESQYIPCSSSHSQPVSDQSSTEHLDSETKSQQEDRIMHWKIRHSPSHEKKYKHPHKICKPKSAHKKYAKQPHSSQPQSKTLARAPNPKKLHPNSWSEGLLAHFIEYLKLLYRSSPVEKCTDVLKLPNPGNVFINLAFIDRNTEGLMTDHNKTKEYDEITEAMVRDGNVDVIEGRKCPIDMNKIASEIPTAPLEKVILVEGAPGVGKSTFAWEFCRRWERGEIAQQYDLVLLLRLRDDSISKARCLRDLIYHPSENVRDAVVSLLESSLGEKVLFILEGYDELLDNVIGKHLLLNLIRGSLLPLAMFMITSRPWATSEILKKFKHRVFQHIEVLGFTTSQVSSYIKETLSAEEAEDLESKLMKYTQIKMIMYIPLNCAIVVTVYKESKAAMPTTLTSLYSTFACTILQRYLRSRGIDCEPFEKFDELPSDVNSNFLALCQLAYDSIAQPGDQVKLIFTDIPKDFDGLGFMDSVFEFFVTRKTVASHNFLHLTLQEFLAAVHISTMDAKQRLEHFKKHADGRLRVVLRFLAGLTELKEIEESSIFLDVMDKPPDYSETDIDYSLSSQVSWVYEAGRGMLIRDSFDEDKTVEFTCEDYLDSSALGYCIAHSRCKWVLTINRMIKEYDVELLVNEVRSSCNSGGLVVGLRGTIEEFSGVFEGLSISLDGLNILFEELHMKVNELALMLPAECSAISWPDLSSLKHLILQIDKSIPWELDSLLPHLSLRSLTFGANNGRPTLLLEDCEAIASHVATTTSLKELSFEFFGNCLEISEEGMKKVFSAMLDNTLLSLHNLSFSGIPIIYDETAEILSNLILRGSFVVHLKFPVNTLTACGALQIAIALSKVHEPIVSVLTCTVNMYDMTDFIELVNRYSQSLDIERISSDLEFHKIGDDGVKKLVKFLCDDSVIHCLNLSENDISHVGAELLGDVLHYNSMVTYLDLSKNDIGDTGAEAVAQALHSNTKLVRLNLSETKIGDDGVKALAQALCHNSSLKSLHLNKNPGISEQGVHCLIRSLTVNTSITSSSWYSDGLVLDRVECQNYAFKCPEYSRVQHKINFFNIF